MPIMIYCNLVKERQKVLCGLFLEGGTLGDKRRIFL